MARKQNTFAKRQREMDKKQKAERKRMRKERRKSETGTETRQPDDTPQEEEALDEGA